MWRLLFVLLLLANLAWAVYAYVFHGKGGSDAAPPLRASEIQLMSAAAVAALPAPASAPVAASAPAALAVCYEWRGVSPKSVETIKTSLHGLGISGKIQEIPFAPPDAKHWVYIPPQPSRAAAEKKISELGELGVTEYHLETAEGKWQWAISLGVFSSEERANNFLTELRNKGVRSARSGPRDGAVVSSTLRFTVPSDTLVPKLVEAQQKYPGSSLKAVGCQ